MFSALINTRTQNNKKHTKKTRLFYPRLACVVVLWQLQSLNLFSALAGRRGAPHNRVTPRRHLSSRVFSEHAYLFSDNSLHSLNITSAECPFLSIKTDELKAKPHHHMTVTTVALILYQPLLFYFLPLCSSQFAQRRMKQGNEEASVLLRSHRQKEKCDDVKSSYDKRDRFNCVMLNLPISVSPPCPLTM